MKDAIPAEGSLQEEVRQLRAQLEDIRQREQCLLVALGAGKIGTWTAEPETGSFVASETAKAIHGLAPDAELNIVNAYDVVHPDDLPYVLATRKQAMETGEPLAAEYRIVRPDGSEGWVLGWGYRLPIKPGHPQKIFGVVQDISERKKMEQRLRQSQTLESIGLLADGIAHDFNNLLTAIIGHASLALREAAPGPAERIREVISSAERAAHLTRQLLAYAGKGQIRAEELDVSQVVKEMQDFNLFSIPKSALLTLSLPENLPRVKMDPRQLQQVVTNLVMNAGEAIGEGNDGNISVSTGTCEAKIPFTDALGGQIDAGRYTWVEVADPGPGMDEDTKSKIFDPFFTTKFIGRGLGLAAVSGIVRSQKGAITLKTAPGRGTAFRVLFPAAPGIQQP